MRMSRMYIRIPDEHTDPKSISQMDMISHTDITSQMEVARKCRPFTRGGIIIGQDALSEQSVFEVKVAEN